MDKYVDFGILGEVIAIAFGAGVGIVVLFTMGTIGLDKFAGDEGQPATVGNKVLGGAMALVGFVTIVVLVVVGTYLMLRKG